MWVAVNVVNDDDDDCFLPSAKNKKFYGFFLMVVYGSKLGKNFNETKKNHYILSK